MTEPHPDHCLVSCISGRDESSHPHLDADVLCMCSCDRCEIEGVCICVDCDPTVCGMHEATS